jgi:hypothetical protein
MLRSERVGARELNYHKWNDEERGEDAGDPDECLQSYNEKYLSETKGN